jgi:hypothetical protein
MYPNNQDIEVFGEQVSWPGVDGNGKFTNGSFSDPMVKPSFIPAETINLALDNLESIIRKCGETPNATGMKQIADLLKSEAVAKSIIWRDENGRAKVAAPEEEDDIARLTDIILTSHGDSREGRNMFDVLHVGSLRDLALKLEERADGISKNPNFSGLLIGDYIDGTDLVAGSLNVPWNNTYKNNRIVLSGFNQYKGCGDTENRKNHFLFTFKDCPVSKRMNATDTNVNGYTATEMRTFLEGDFKNALVAAMGGDFILPVRRLLSTSDSNWAWETDTVFLPTEYEVLGAPVWSHVGYGGGFQCQFPIFQNSCEYLVKRLNGSRTSYWLASQRAGSSAHFVRVNGSGHSYNLSYASAVLGCAPAFCVASRHE